MGGYSHQRKHLRFTKQRRGNGKKTDTWQISNLDGQALGIVVYRPGWRRYVTRYGPIEGAIDFDSKCHLQAAAFCHKQTAKLKATWKKQKER